MGLSEPAVECLGSPANHQGVKPWPSHNKVIITCAVTGSIHTPSMSPHLPITAQQIADAAIGAAEAGAAVVHLHARNPQDGRPDQTPEAFAPFLKVIKQRSPVVVNITTGGAPTMSIEERVKPAATFKPEVASLNMGTMNFGLYPMIPRYKGKFKYDWEEPYLEGTRKGMFKNTLADIEYILTTCAGEQHPLRDRVLRHRPSLHAAGTSSTAAWSSRRCSCSRCSASSAASARIPRTS